VTGRSVGSSDPTTCVVTDVVSGLQTRRRWRQSDVRPPGRAARLPCRRIASVASPFSPHALRRTGGRESWPTRNRARNATTPASLLRRRARPLHRPATHNCLQRAALCVHRVRRDLGGESPAGNPERDSFGRLGDAKEMARLWPTAAVMKARVNRERETQ